MISLTDLFGEDAHILHHEDFQLLLLANVITVLGTALVSPILDSLTVPFGVSATRIGLVVTAFAVPGVVLIPLVGVLVDRIGRKPVLVSALVLFGCAGTAIAFTTDFEVVLALRLLQGVGFSGTVPVIITSVGDLYSGAEEATGQGLRFAIAGVSQGLFPVVAGSLVVVAWQYPFFLYALAIPVALVVALRLEEPTGDSERESEPPDSTTASSEGDRASPGADDDPARSRRGYVRRLAGLLRERRVAAILLARGLLVVPFIGFLTYNSLVTVRLLGGTPQLAGLTVATFSLVYAAAAAQAGRITAASGNRTVPLVVSNACLLVGLAVFALAGDLVALFVGIVLLGAGVGVLFSLYRSLITGFAPRSLRGGLVSVSESLGRLAAAGTPLAMGGAILALEPIVGEGLALRWTVLGAAVLGGTAGIVLTLVATRARPVSETGESHW